MKLIYSFIYFAILKLLIVLSNLRSIVFFSYLWYNINARKIAFQFNYGFQRWKPIDHRECARDKLCDRTATWPMVKVLQLVWWDVGYSAHYNDGLIVLLISPSPWRALFFPKLIIQFLQGGFCMSRNSSLQGFAWHIEYVPLWKLGYYSKPKSKSKPKSTKPKVEKHEWIDWSQFGKYKNNGLVCGWKFSLNSKATFISHTSERSNFNLWIRMRHRN